MQYLLFRYCSDSSKSDESFNIFKKKIIRFNKFSPKFGRSILHLPKKNKSIILPFKSKIPDEKYFTYETKFINYNNNNFTEESYEPVLAKNIIKRKNIIDYDSDDDRSTTSNDTSISDIETPPGSPSNNIETPPESSPNNNDTTIDFSNDVRDIISSILHAESNTFNNSSNERLIIPIININGNIPENFQIDQTSQQEQLNIIQNYYESDDEIDYDNDNLED